MLPKFHVESIPPSEADIQKIQQFIVLIRRAFTLLTILLFIGFIANFQSAPDYAGGCFFTGMVALALSIIFAGWNEYEPIDPDNCEKMLKYCEATPEGVAYRTAVLTQGRKFVYGDFCAMRTWAEEADTRAACKKLYNIPLDVQAQK